MKPFGATAIRRSKDCYTSLGKGAFGLGVRPELRETRVFTREGREKKRGKNAEILCNTDQAGGSDVLGSEFSWAEGAVDPEDGAAQAEGGTAKAEEIQLVREGGRVSCGGQEGMDRQRWCTFGVGPGSAR